MGAPRSYVPENEFPEILAHYPELTCPFTSRPRGDDEEKNNITHKIVVNQYPCSARARPLSPEKLACAQKEIDDLLEAGIVRRSDSPYSSPLHLVPRTTENGGTYRLCGDYRQLNKMTVKDNYPIPNAQTLFYRLAGSKIFSKIDLVKAYYQLPIDPESVPLTAVITPLGLCEYLYTPFDLVNGGSTFQRFVDQVLHNMPNVIAYVDDLIIFSASEEEHKRHLHEVFQKLGQYDLVINPTKSQMGSNELKFLGHLVTPDGILPLTERVEAAQNYPMPETFKQLRGYLGFINYYHRFVKNLAECLAPL